jgi:hypothetical protein
MRAIRVWEGISLLLLLGSLACLLGAVGVATSPLITDYSWNPELAEAVRATPLTLNQIAILTSLIFCVTPGVMFGVGAGAIWGLVVRRKQSQIRNALLAARASHATLIATLDALWEALTARSSESVVSAVQQAQQALPRLISYDRRLLKPLITQLEQDPQANALKPIPMLSAVAESDLRPLPGWARTSGRLAAAILFAISCFCAGWAILVGLSSAAFNPLYALGAPYSPLTAVSGVLNCMAVAVVVALAGLGVRTIFGRERPIEREISTTLDQLQTTLVKHFLAWSDRFLPLIQQQPTGAQAWRLASIWATLVSREVAPAQRTAMIRGLYAAGALQGPRALRLQGADLSAVDLQGADLSGVQLTGVRLIGAKLQQANLTAATLAGADLSAADLRGADLSAMDLQQAHLADAQMHRCNLCGANLLGADLTRANMWRSQLAGAKVDRAQLARALSLKEATGVDWLSSDAV